MPSGTSLGACNTPAGAVSKPAVHPVKDVNEAACSPAIAALDDANATTTPVAA